jgi:glycerol dehydrogenase
VNDIGLPTTLAGLGLDSVSEADLLAVGRVACGPERPMRNEPREFSPEDVADALRTVDALGVRIDS